MGKKVIDLTESQFYSLVENTSRRVLQENGCSESWLGNLFKGAGETMVDQAKKGYNKIGMNVNQRNAEEQGQKADQLQKELEGMPAQIKQQVAAFRRQKMAEVNKEVAKYAAELKADMKKKQGKLDSTLDKKRGYAERSAQQRERYNKLQQKYQEPQAQPQQ